MRFSLHCRTSTNSPRVENRVCRTGSTWRAGAWRELATASWSKSTCKRVPILRHLPSTSSLEVLVLFSSLTTTDPGSISKTLTALVSSRVRVSIIALAAELKICRTITERTGGRFGVALNEQHYRELVFEAVQAPATQSTGALGIRSALDRAQRAAEGRGKPPPCDLMMMGFPTRLPVRGTRSLCACHGLMKQGGYLCPRCGSKVCEVPTDCEICGLMVVSSPHLARRWAQDGIWRLGKS